MSANPAVADTFRYDDLQRLVGATTFGLNGTDRVDQTFTYDRWGNRIASTAAYTGHPLNKPTEALAWTAAASSFADTNSLPASVTGTGGMSLSTGVQYDELGRMKQVWAIPGTSYSLVSWGYDASGRVVSEGSDTFLLDAEGLRFKRIRSNRSQVYTVYGFGREPLAVFETAAGSEPVAPGSNVETAAGTSTSRKASNRPKGSAAKGGAK